MKNWNEQRFIVASHRFLFIVARKEHFYCTEIKIKSKQKNAQTEREREKCNIWRTACIARVNDTLTANISLLMNLG